MNTEIELKQKNEMQISQEQQNIIYEVVAKGNLKSLKPEQKMQYIQAKCIGAGIPLDRASDCFEICEMQGKEVLYAKKGFAEIVRDVRRVHCKVLSSVIDKENGLYSVKVFAQLPNGRSEEAMAVVEIGTAKGKDLANLMMKCETKAKRRVTLALCGLGIEERNFESENTYDISEIPLKTALLTAQNDEVEPWNQEPVTEVEKINPAQVKRLQTILKAETDIETGERYPLPRWTGEQAKDFTLSFFGFSSSKDITVDKYDEIVNYFKSHGGHFSEAEG